ncbi:MAG: hypothetical protein ACOC7N_03660 [Chloroflexota bacterium]
MSIIFVRGNPNTLLGPTPVGLIGGIGFTVVAGAILMSVSGRPGADEGIG